MKKIIFLVDDVRLTIHWYYIGKLRQKAKAMLDKGAGSFHPELVKCSNKILSHGMVVSKIWQRQKKYSPRYLDIDTNEQADTQSATA